MQSFFNKGIFTICEETTYTMSTQLAYKKFTLPLKDDKNHHITSKTYRRWAREQRRTLNRTARKLRKNKLQSLYFIDYARIMSSADKFGRFTVTEDLSKNKKTDEEYYMKLLKNSKKRKRKTQSTRKNHELFG